MGYSSRIRNVFDGNKRHPPKWSKGLVGETSSLFVKRGWREPGLQGCKGPAGSGESWVGQATEQADMGTEAGVQWCRGVGVL